MSDLSKAKEIYNKGKAIYDKMETFKPEKKVENEKEKNKADQNKEKEQTEILVYIDKLLSLQSLEIKDKNKLEKLKTEIETTKKLESSQIDMIDNVLKKLESKTDLEEGELEIVKGVQNFLSAHKTSIDGLKNNVADEVIKKKQEMIDKIYKELDSHWYSSRLADNVKEYLEKKFIKKERAEGRFERYREKLTGGILIGIAGLFLPTGVRNLLDAIKGNGSLEDITDNIKDNVGKLENQAAHTKEMTKEELDNLKPKAKQQVKTFLEEKLGKKLDESKYGPIFEDRWKERGGKLSSTSTEVKNEYSGEGVHVLTEGGKLLLFPARASIDLIVRLVDAGLSSRSEIGFNLAFLPSGKAVLQAGTFYLGLFGNGIRSIIGQCSFEEYGEYIKSNVDKLSSDSKQAMRGSLYRHGGPFWTLAGKIGDITGEAISLLFMDKHGGIGQAMAYWKGGVAGNLQKELQVLEQLEKNMMGTGILGDIDSKFLKNMFEAKRQEIVMLGISNEAKNIDDIENLLKKHNMPKEILEELQGKKAWKKGNMKQIRTHMGTIMENEIAPFIKEARKTLDTRASRIKGSVNLAGNKVNFEKEFIDTMEQSTKNNSKLVQETEFLHTVKKASAKFDKGRSLSKMVALSDRSKLYFKDVKDAKEFFDNINTIGRSHPSMLKQLFKSLPIFMVGKETFDKLIDPNTKDPDVLDVLGGFAQLVPIVGPAILLNELTISEDGGVEGLGTAGVGAGLITLDGIRLVNAAKLQGIKGLGKFLIEPLVDLKNIALFGADKVQLTRKFAKTGVNILKGGQYAEFAKELAKFTGKKLLVAGILVGGGYWLYSLADGFLNDEKDKAELKKLQDKTPAEIEDMVKEERPKLEEEEKVTMIKLAVAHRAGIANLDNLEVSKSGKEIVVVFNTLLNYDQIKHDQADMQTVIDTLEGATGTTISYEIDPISVKDELLALKNNFFHTDASGTTFDAKGMIEYIKAMGYSQNNALSLVKQVINKETYETVMNSIKKGE